MISPEPYIQRGKYTIRFEPFPGNQGHKLEMDLPHWDNLTSTYGKVALFYKQTDGQKLLQRKVGGCPVEGQTRPSCGKGRADEVLLPE